MIMNVLLSSVAVAYESTYIFSDWEMNNFWEKVGKPQEKIFQVHTNLIMKNRFDKRVPVIVVQNKEVNAVTNKLDRKVQIYSGILPLIENDDELAFIIGHEMAHAVEVYNKGILGVWITTFNSKTYEYKSDLKSIDYMVKAGYDPISAIIFANKFLGEPLTDWGFWNTHPKGSKRLIAMYKYIYKKYPQYLSSEKTQSPYYKNFEYMYAEQLKSFQHKEQIRQQKQQAKRGADL